MSSNVKCWDHFRSPQVSSSFDGWVHDVEKLENADFLSVRSLYGETPYDIPCSALQATSRALAQGELYISDHQNQYGFTSQLSASDYPPRDSVINQDYLRRQDIMNCEVNSWRSASEKLKFLDGEKVADENSTYHRHHLDAPPFNSDLSIIPTATYYADHYMVPTNSLGPLGREKTSPSTACSMSSSLSAPFSQSCLIERPFASASKSINESAKATWWQYQAQQEPVISLGGNPENQLHSYGEVWGVSEDQLCHWTSFAVEPSTISPEALTLNNSVLADLAQTDEFSISEYSMTPSFKDEEERVELGAYSHCEKFQPDGRYHIRKQATNRSLEDKSRRSKTDNDSLLEAKRAKSRSVTKNKIRSSKSSTRISPKDGHSTPESTEPTLKPKHGFPHIIKKLEETEASQTVPHSFLLDDGSLLTVEANVYRDAKDDFLVKSKLAGMPYKDIRREGKFTEAESTLRGRFRTLTKHKAARVRKPEWNENDVRLLKKAVHKMKSATSFSKPRIPWKKVAEYIADNGGSYHFGNATCRKRWDELRDNSEE